MRVLVLGANGFIGSAVLARLVGRGDSVVAVARRRGLDERNVRWLRIDLARAVTPEDWTLHLTGIDAIVNCAGLLQSAPGDDARRVHVDAVAALADAAVRAGVRRFVHLSAVGADTPRSAFSETKAEGEAALEARDLDWVVLRPSVVVGRPAYGGSALLRGLAALPVAPRLPGAGELSTVQLDDVVDAIMHFLDPEVPARRVFDVAGPERLQFHEAVAAYRRWLRWPPAREVNVPGWLLATGWRLGDLAAWLGWRTPLRSTAGREMVRGAVGDPAPLAEATGRQPRRLGDALAAEPASVQERWFARLYFVKPFAFAIFAAFWILTGIVSLGPGWDVGVEYMRRGGADNLAAPGVIAGALADIAIGLGIAWRRTAKPALYAALAISVFYLVAGTLLLPVLWADPIGPMMKIWPILALNLVLLAIVEDR